MKLGTIAACGAMILSLTGCDRLKALTDQARQTASVPARCAYPGSNYDYAKERQDEAKAIKANPGLVERQGDTLTFFHDGKIVATVKDCYSFYTGSLNLKNTQSGQIETYPVFSTGVEQSVIVDHDGTPHIFQGTLMASPDGRYVASGEARQSEYNERLMITDWTSPGLKSRVWFGVTCSPVSWTAEGLKVSCDRTDPSRFFSDGIVTPTAEGWQLQETQLNLLREDRRQPFGPHEPDKPEGFVSEIPWPADAYNWIDGGKEIYSPAKGDALPPRLPDITVSLLDPATGQLTAYKPATSTSNGIFYLLTIDKDHAYDIGKNPKVSPDGRFLLVDTHNNFLIDWAHGRTEIYFEGVRCLDGVWTSATRLTAYCSGDETVDYVEAEIAQSADGTWTFRDISPVHLTTQYSWVRYKSATFVARTLKGQPHDSLLNEVYHPENKASS